VFVYFISETPNVVFERLAFLLRNSEIPGENFGPDTGWFYKFFFFSQPFKENAGIVPYIRSRTLPFMSFAIYYSVTIISFEEI
jgi:hypothetical protein